jgi:hypothetical protein
LTKQKIYFADAQRATLYLAHLYQQQWESSSLTFMPSKQEKKEETFEMMKAGDKTS